ncbi:sulfurtransferase [Pseudomonas aeruginosa]|jgi:thiosulfate sulfurtransferase|uniref:sulfurtransferase n=1 Tax=Pseudomonas aeruginosa TaxID=287 RepID=UPI0021F24BCA|nr:sulfurtransferase [Pseudomonas aeruginosa]MCV6184666.1 sulfurtransferase [Pseudomonas aeruginosa]MCV6217663.1 sulfurtransferase [Pseudomonas aeruginosa]MCV6428599.1 sulfurtransferase [Pseudomonas aeruginosa]MCV6431428.1 sulfurtransferase [Pseudomonas aeruginosa]MCV6438872.1 sulfurtransferase [Pseudomonas aeruginosa]
MSRISICELAEWQAADRTFTLLDVRRTSVRLADAEEIPGAHWRDPEDVFTWKDQVARDRPVIVYCAKGHEISQGIAAKCGRSASTKISSGALCSDLPKHLC